MLRRGCDRTAVLGVEADRAGGAADLVEEAALKGVAAAEYGALLFRFDVAGRVLVDSVGEVCGFDGAAEGQLDWR